MTFYAHTAEDEQGNRLPETHWQPLATHLSNVADLAQPFAVPLMGIWQHRFTSAPKNP